MLENKEVMIVVLKIRYVIIENLIVKIKEVVMFFKFIMEVLYRKLSIFCNDVVWE